MRCQNTIFTTHLTTITPSKHHDQTRTFPKTPLKNPAKQQRLSPHHAGFFLQNYYFSRRALTTISLGEIPAGRIVKSAGPCFPSVRITATSPERASAASKRCSSSENASASGEDPVRTLPASFPSSML